MKSKALIRGATYALIASSLAACGGGSAGSGSTSGTGPQSVQVPLLITDSPSDDWAMVGVKILSVALVPQGGGANVTVYNAPDPAPVVNLVQLDDLNEIIGDGAIPAGTYTDAVLTIAANTGDVSLTTSSDPESGFAAPASTAIAPAAIVIQHTSGSAGALSTSVDVSFKSPLTVAAGQSTPVDIDFNLSHPAFIVDHTPPALNGATVWSVDFNGPVRHRPVADIRRLLLRHIYGSVSGIASNNSAITIAKQLPTFPAVTPETAVGTGVSLTILADTTNGTLFYDVDAGTVATIRDFSSVAAVLANGESVRVAARFQQDGSLVAVRMWASSSFARVWFSPEGHVRHVDATAGIITVDDQNGMPVQLTVDANTQFYFRTPDNAQADATPIGTGTGFLAGDNLVRGFKIHASVVDPLAVPLVAQTVDIEQARYAGRISGANTTSFMFTRNFVNTADDYQVTLPYIDSATAQNPNASGMAVSGFQWWNFMFPTLADTGSTAIPDFISATNSAGLMFGATALNVTGVTSAIWGDPANASGWSAPFVVLTPIRLPLGSVSTALTTGGANPSFAMTPWSNAGAAAVTVDVDVSPGQATLAYQVDRSTGTVTVSSEDLTTSAGIAALASGLAVGAPVRVYAVPEANGNLKAYAIVYFTGTRPAS